MYDLMFFGMQGSGKGTQWKIIAKKYGYKVFETWAEIRKIARIDSDLWRKVKETIESWNLIDTSIVMEIVDDFLNRNSYSEKVIFDWIPRNKEQFEAFEKLMKSHNRRPMWVYIKLEREEAKERLLKRFTCEGVDMTSNPLMTEDECVALGGKVVRRADDTEEAIERRLDVFFSETAPIIESYKKQDRMFEVNWINSVSLVTVEILDKI